jgi:pimeloyl-ACP methyl ester carboxylesterase
VYSRPGVHRALRLRPEAVVNLGRMGRSLLAVDGRATFVSAARAVITPRGQLGNMLDHGYVVPTRPTLIMWSAHDPIIPVAHAQAAHARLPNSRLVLVDGTSHEPHRRHPRVLADAVAELISVQRDEV